MMSFYPKSRVGWQGGLGKEGQNYRDEGDEGSRKIEGTQRTPTTDPFCPYRSFRPSASIKPVAQSLAGLDFLGASFLDSDAAGAAAEEDGELAAEDAAAPSFRAPAL